MYVRSVKIPQTAFLISVMIFQLQEFYMFPRLAQFLVLKLHLCPLPPFLIKLLLLVKPSL